MFCFFGMNFLIQIIKINLTNNNKFLIYELLFISSISMESPLPSSLSF